MRQTRQMFSRLVVASGLLTLACATAMEDGPLNGDIGEETGGRSSAGSLATSGTTSNISGSSSSAGTTSATGGTKANAFGGTGPTVGGAAGSSKGGGGGIGGAAAGSSSGGKAGTASGGSATAGSTSGGKGGSSGSATGGSGTAGSTSATCSGVADWAGQKTYVLGDMVASTCTGVFAGACTAGQHHKFECNPTAGAAALPWCQSREPGVGNGWGEAWVDKGQCQ